MTNLYTPMSLALQAHWKTHNNAYPQKFVLTDSALTTLNQVRKLNRPGFRGGSTL